MCSCAGVRLCTDLYVPHRQAGGVRLDRNIKRFLCHSHVTRYMNTPPLSAGGRPARANLSPCSLSPTPDVGRRVLQGLGGGDVESECVCVLVGRLRCFVHRHVCVCAYALRRKVGGRGWGGGMIVVDEFIIKDMAPSTLSPLLSHCIVTNRPHEA